MVLVEGEDQSLDFTASRTNLEFGNGQLGVASNEALGSHNCESDCKMTARPRCGHISNQKKNLAATLLNCSQENCARRGGRGRGILYRRCMYFEVGHIVGDPVSKHTRLSLYLVRSWKNDCLSVPLPPTTVPHPCFFMLSDMFVSCAFMSPSITNSKEPKPQQHHSNTAMYTS